MNKIIKTIKKYEARSMHGQLPLVWDSAFDEFVLGNKGNKYIDFTSGICVTNVGHGNNEIIKAIERCIYNPLLYSYTFYTEERAKFLEYLINNTPDFIEKAFLVSSGTEATEVAVKLMRIATGKQIIISFKGSMHGRSMLSEYLRGMNSNNSWAGYSYADVVHLPFPNKNTVFNPNDVMEFLDDEIAGIMIETYQGWSGRFYPKKYIKNLIEWCKEKKVLICFDEIQGGMGRTGKLFNYMHYNVEPDLVCVGKGFSGSLPLSGVLGRKWILDKPEVGSMSSTHSANPLCCSVGLANFKEVQRLIPNSRKLGKLLHIELNKRLKKFEINGKGLMAVIIMEKEKADKVCLQCMEKGLLLIKTDTDSIKIAPPLCISEDTLLKGIDILVNTINSIFKNNLR